jgi:uncharacterized protein DUF1236
MNKTLMITVSGAALVAAGGVAFAQGANEPREKPAATAPVQNGKSDRMKVDAPRATDAVKPGSSAQLPTMPKGVKSDTDGQGMQAAPRGEASPSDHAAPKTPAQADAKHAAPAALSAEQHAKVWEAIRGEKMAPVTGAKFSMTVGEAVPQTVHLNRLPALIMEYAPQYRGYEYIQVGDDILIVDPRTHLIVAVIVA